VTQTQVETMRRIDVSVRPEEAPETSRLATVTGFYGTAVAPPGSALISWQGVNEAGPQQPGDKGKGKNEDDNDNDDDEQGQPNPPLPDEPIPEPEEPPDSSDPSDPTQH
jgi:hypothetical protein